MQRECVTVTGYNNDHSPRCPFSLSIFPRRFVCKLAPLGSELLFKCGFMARPLYSMAQRPWWLLSSSYFLHCLRRYYRQSGDICRTRFSFLASPHSQGLFFLWSVIRTYLYLEFSPSLERHPINSNTSAHHFILLLQVGAVCWFSWIPFTCDAIIVYLSTLWSPSQPVTWAGGLCAPTCGHQTKAIQSRNSYHFGLSA